MIYQFLISDTLIRSEIIRRYISTRDYKVRPSLPVRCIPGRQYNQLDFASSILKDERIEWCNSDPIDAEEERTERRLE